MKKISASLMLLAMMLVSFPALGASTVDWACMNTAVAERDSELAAAWTKYGTDMSAALTKRTAGMQDAVNQAKAIGDDSQAWLKFKQLAKPVAKTYASDVKKATNAWNQAKRAAKLEYLKTAKQECKASSEAPTGGE